MRVALKAKSWSLLRSSRSSAHKEFVGGKLERRVIVDGKIINGIRPFFYKRDTEICTYILYCLIGVSGSSTNVRGFRTLPDVISALNFPYPVCEKFMYVCNGMPSRDSSHGCSCRV